ncbi:unnamed protein product, partial [marine sediment metagenome]
PYFYVDDLNGKYKSIYNEPLKKIYTTASGDVIEERKKYGRSFESNIRFVQRYLIDRVPVPFPKRNLRLCFIDIETDDSLNTNLTPKPLTCVSFYDSYSKKYAVFVWQDGLNGIIEKSEEINIYKFDNELHMISNILKFIQAIDPDLLIGFNTDFDLGYLINRAKRLQLYPNIISPMNYTKIDRWGVKVYGRVVFDMKKGYRTNFNDKNLGIYNLDNIAKHVLGRGKKEIGITPGEL